jgi:hypothetical protein
MFDPDQFHRDACFVYFESRNKTLTSYKHRAGPLPGGGPGRGCCVEHLVRDAYELSLKRDFKFIVCCGDMRMQYPQIPDVKTFYFHTETEDYEDTVPCYAFHSLSLKGRYGFSGEGSDRHEDFVISIMKAGEKKPKCDLGGFAGTIGTHKREYFFKQVKEKPLSDFCEFIEVSWLEPTQNEQSWPTNFITIPEQVERWRFIVDLPGLTWTDRTKFYFFSRRPMILVDRPHKEFYFKNLTPWVHYVPARDADDVCRSISKLLEDPSLEKEIAQNALEFAQKNLTRNNALERYRNIMDNQL